MTSAGSGPTGTEWANWSGGVRSRPRQRAEPRSEQELAELLADDDGRRVRVVGSGHSFVPLCATDRLLVSVDRLSGVVEADPERGRATVLAGTRLHALGEPLLAAGLGLENQGDIDRQSIAGAISTGTHGTGRALGSLATQVVALRLLTPGGAIHDLDVEHPDFAGAVLSLGALGVVSRYTLRVLPAYRLHERMEKLPFDDCMARLEETTQEHRHCEFFWFPGRDLCVLKTLHPTEREPDPHLAYDAERFEGERIDWSHRVFPSQRERRFEEIEYAVPAEAGPAAVAELRELLQRDFPDVEWPLEYRTVAADSLWLSPAHGRDVVTISAHQGAGLPWRDFFRAVEAVLRAHGGRPHWGKQHTLKAPDLAPLYPKWNDFLDLRRRLDPDGRMLNPYLRELFGL